MWVRERASRREVRVEGCHLLQLQSNGKKIKLYLSSIQSHMKIFSCLRLLQPTSHRCTPTLSKHVPSRLPIVIANAQFFPTYVSCFKIAMPKKMVCCLLECWSYLCIRQDESRINLFDCETNSLLETTCSFRWNLLFARSKINHEFKWLLWPVFLQSLFNNSYLLTIFAHKD